MFRLCVANLVDLNEVLLPSDLIRVTATTRSRPLSGSWLISTIRLREWTITYNCIYIEIKLHLPAKTSIKCKNLLRINALLFLCRELDTGKNCPEKHSRILMWHQSIMFFHLLPVFTISTYIVRVHINICLYIINEILFIFKHNIYDSPQYRCGNQT